MHVKLPPLVAYQGYPTGIMLAGDSHPPPPDGTGDAAGIRSGEEASETVGGGSAPGKRQRQRSKLISFDGVCSVHTEPQRDALRPAPTLPMVYLEFCVCVCMLVVRSQAAVQHQLTASVGF